VSASMVARRRGWYRRLSHGRTRLGIGGLILALAVALPPAPASATSPYVAIDLDTLGSSFSTAVAINSVGMVAGTRHTSAPAEHAFFWSAATGMVDLGTLPGHNHSKATAINSSGVVAGYSWHDSDGLTEAFIWSSATGMTGLGTLSGDDASVAWDINDAGQVVGSSSSSSTLAIRAFAWTEASGMSDLGTLGGSDSIALAVNESGQVTGRSRTASGDYHAFFWSQADGMTDLATLGGAYSFAHAINDSGQIVGQSHIASGDMHGFSWTQAGGMIDIGSTALPRDVDNGGRAYGGAPAFYWTQSGGFTSLGSPAGGCCSRIDAANDAGTHAAGTFTTASDEDHALLWTASTGLVDLGTLGGEYSAGRDTNDSGQVVGEASLTSGPVHATMWVAVSGKQISASLPAGGSLSTDTEGDGATPYHPLEASVTTPNAGDVTIETQPAVGAPPSGYLLPEQQVIITAPPATAAGPLILVFRIDASVISGPVSDISIQRNGAAVADCSAADATPDPCVAARTLLADGDGEITVRTSAASTWTFAIPIGPSGIRPNLQDQLDQIDAQIALTMRKQDVNRLQDARGRLADALVAGLWADDSHLDSNKGEKVFQLHKQAVQALLAQARHRRSTVDATVLQAWIDTIVRADRELAVTALAEAIDAGGDARKIAQSTNEIDKGDDAALDKPDQAIEFYRNAWKKALGAMP
jgi:probable HAF family extracellular repeat protein